MTDFSAEEIRRRYKSLPKPQRDLVSQFIEQQAEIAASLSQPDDAARPANLTHRATGRLVFDDGPDGGELLYSGICLRHGANGVLSPEEDHSIAPPPDLATDQLWFAWMLSSTNYGFITRNEDHDIHPQFVRLLQQKRAVFEAVGFDINTIQSRVNI